MKSEKSEEEEAEEEEAEEEEIEVVMPRMDLSPAVRALLVEIVLCVLRILEEVLKMETLLLEVDTALLKRVLGSLSQSPTASVLLSAASFSLLPTSCSDI